MFKLKIRGFILLSLAILFLFQSANLSKSEKGGFAEGKDGGWTDH